MKTVTLTFSITINASPQTVFNYVSDWEKQSDWILFTTVKQLSDPPVELNANLLAITKLGPLKLIDTMVITDWKPYKRIVVEHTGRLVLGKGVFSMREQTSEKCEFSWQEITPVPFGFAGRIGLAFAKPILGLLFNASLRKLKHNIESSRF